MTEREYARIPAVRRSELWNMKRSPMHMLWAKEHPEEPTAAMMMGSAIHAAVMCPEEFKQDYATLNIDRRTKAGRESYEAYRASHPATQVLSESDYRIVTECAEAVKKQRTAYRLLTGGENEKAHVWTDEDTGIQLKVKTDSEILLNGELWIVDFKTTTDAGTASFTRDALRLGYAMQAAMYMEGCRKTGCDPKGFVFVAVEKSAPYAVNILEVSQDLIDYGMDEFRLLLGRYAECEKSGVWPSYNDGIAGVMELPAWKKKGDSDE